ncbi:MAG TPA: c-type cytochrome [Gemmatimonadales bacterium]|nr:c-type cytochrome [Gemmatimonadales bacterium]
MQVGRFWIRRAAIFALTVLADCRVRQLPPRPVTGPVTETLRPPPDSLIPDNVIGAAIRRGRALLANTRDSLPANVGSDLRCFSCHLKEGTQPGALPLIGAYSRYPQYRSRNGLVNLIEDRINDCFERSLNGKALPRDGRDMRDMVAFLAFISRGVAPPGDVPGVGTRALEPLPPDTVQGSAIFAETCSRCHGAEGAGTALAPPLWGPRSFNVAAGMARLRTAAAFIRDNMPNDRAVILTDQHAYDVAAYVVSRPRPDFARKSDDWPKGDPPPDVSYPTRAATLKASGAPPKP